MIFNILLTYPKSESKNLFLKEAVSWDFFKFFFHESNPSGSLIILLKKLVFEDIHEKRDPE